MDTKQLEYFISVAELLNFTKAAEKFYISQTAMSLQIKSLEQSLNAKLFFRNSRNVRLTPAGAAFYKEAKVILNQVNNAIKDVTNISSGYNGSLRIGFIREHNSPAIYNLIRNFHLKFPDIDLTLIDDKIENLCEQLSNNSLDLIFTVDFNLNDYDKFSWKILNSEPVCAIMNKDHPLSKNKTLNRYDLRNENIIALDRLIAPHGFDKMIGSCVECGFSPKIIKQCSSIEIMLLMVSLNIGISLFPKSISQSLYHDLVYIPLCGDNEFIYSVLVWNNDNHNQSINLFLNSIS